MQLIFLCRNEDDPAALCCGAHTRLNEKMYIYSCCRSCNKRVTVLLMPRHLNDKTFACWEYCIAHAKFHDQKDANYETRFQDLKPTSTSF